MAGWQCLQAPAPIHLPKSCSDKRTLLGSLKSFRQTCMHATAAAGLPQSPSSHSSIQQLNIAAAHGAATKHDQQSPEAGSGGGNGGSSRMPPWGPGRGGDGDGDGPGQQLVCPHTTLLQQLLAVLSSLLFSMLLPAPSQAAAAASKRSGLVSKHDERMESSWQLDAFVDRMWDLSSPIINNMGFSGLVGACAAAALKWVGRTLAASLGLGLVIIQVMSHYNLISVNWSVVHKQARQVLDTTGDGRLDQDDFKRVVKQGLVVMSEGVPSLSGFLVGFLVGLKVF